MLDEVLRFILNDLLQEVAIQRIRSLVGLFEELPLITPQNSLLIEADEVKAYGLELLCIVSMSQQHHRNDI